MIDREQLARVLDPDAWNLPESIGTQLYRRHALERADRLLSDPRWAVLQLPEPNGNPDMDPSWHADGYSLSASLTEGDVWLGFGCGPSVWLEPAEAEALAAAILAASRAAQQQDTEAPAFPSR